MELVKRAIEVCYEAHSEVLTEWAELLDRATGEPWQDTSVRVNARKFAAAILLCEKYYGTSLTPEYDELAEAVRELSLYLPEKFEDDLAAALGRCKTNADRDVESKHSIATSTGL